MYSKEAIAQQYNIALHSDSLGTGQIKVTK